jgi:hypothetical protein
MFFINEMTLLKGSPFIINEKLTIKHPTLNEIVEIGEEEYFKFIGLFCCRPYDYMVELDEQGVIWEDKTNYDIFLMVYDYNQYSKIFNWFLNGEYYFQHAKNKENEEFILYDPVNDIIIDKLIYEQISSFLKRINFRSDTREFNPANSEARAIILDQKRKELRRIQMRQGRNESQLSTLISFLVWNNSNGMKFDDIFQLRIYQFHDGIRRLIKTDNYRNIMMGYYTGNISGKDIKFDSIDWTNKTNIE